MFSHLDPRYKKILEEVNAKKIDSLMKDNARINGKYFKRMMEKYEVR
ncbi:MAG: hypothetical protein KAU20_00175 [Nanoarchaeota archaeon]|nr:hypothetical protein [Nanoarchaeota archaeon]